MFAIGETKTKLYRSDEVSPIKAKIGKSCLIFEPLIDQRNVLKIPMRLNHTKAEIHGCITTVEIDFVRKDEC